LFFNFLKIKLRLRVDFYWNYLRKSTKKEVSTLTKEALMHPSWRKRKNIIYSSKRCKGIFLATRKILFFCVKRRWYPSSALW